MKEKVESSESMERAMGEVREANGGPGVRRARSASPGTPSPQIIPSSCNEMAVSSRKPMMMIPMAAPWALAPPRSRTEK